MGANDPNASLCGLSHDVRHPADGQLANTRAPEDITVVFFVFRYLFEGVGFLVSSILVSNISEIKRINQNGIKKM